jgi:hypothetical protein
MKLPAFSTELELVTRGGGMKFVRAKATAALEATGVAVTLYEPCCAFALQGADASPERSVMMPTKGVPFEKAQEGPLAGAENSTRTPGAGRPAESRTNASSGVAKAVLGAVD